ncbi:hypothetical protein H2201_001194 [Coniosporium apollinis]|uniref:Leo1-like protein n=1 Tax=Coniosporium apollinis TaxID=61459 RepID=A0ABQ9P1R1_9PEZI|nr:hypothetical protein H2201_001194 [Coniosporium apollinis]
MASAAAVEADISAPPRLNTLNEDKDITAAVIGRDEPTPDAEDDEDEVVRKVRRTTETNNDEDALPDDDEEPPEGDDLFGDDDEEAAKPKRRQLDDNELDSGDDLDRDDRMASGTPAVFEEAEQQLSTEETVFPRHAIPDPSDNELYLLKVPRFLAIEPKHFHLDTFQPPTRDHHSKPGDDPSPTFSAYNTALSTLRYRHSPSNPSVLQSNARILRWSDGSITLQFASDATQQYEIDGNALAPPQRNPLKPTPTSISDKKKARPGHGSAGPIPPSTHYNPAQDSFTYLVAPNPSTGFLRTTNKITAGLSIQQSKNTADEALERLIAARSKAKEKHEGGAIALPVVMREDPEKRKREAEAAEREKLRAARRTENLANRTNARAATGARGVRSGGAGLTVGGLEDEEGGRRGDVRKRGKKRPNRRGDIYTDEEDEGYGRRKTREDEYDEEDDFIAGSEEEIEMVEEDDIDAGIEEQEQKRRGKSRSRSATPKRRRESPAAGGEDEADEAGVVSRGKRRRVIDDEDDE